MHRNDLHSVNGNNSIFDASGFPRKKIQLPRDVGRGWFRKRWGLLGYRTWPEGAFIITLWQPSCFLKCSPTDLQEHDVHWLSMPCSYMVMHSSHTYIKQWVSLLPSCPTLDLATCYEKNSIKSSPVCHYEAIWNVENGSHTYSGVPCNLSPPFRVSCAGRERWSKMQKLHEKGKCFNPCNFHPKLRNWIWVQTPLAFTQLFLPFLPAIE